ncbi:MAG: hypothetical protein WCK06_00750 [Actinomycetota bacterium]
MPPIQRFVPCCAAEPAQEGVPYGRWAEALRGEFLNACLRIETDGVTLGDPGEIVWFPDRTYHGRTYVPATARTSEGLELYGYVSFLRGDEGADPTDFVAVADFTEETADANPEWTIDLCDEPIAAWRGEEGKIATMTLVWGIPLVKGGALATAELADLAVDQCEIVAERFSLIAPDDYRGDTLEVAIWSRRGDVLARESLYEDDGEE